MDYDDRHEVLVTVGGSEAIDMAMRVMLNPGEEVLIPQPSYVSYEPCTIMAGGKPVIIELKAENEFQSDTGRSCWNILQTRQNCWYCRSRTIRPAQSWSRKIWKRLQR